MVYILGIDHLVQHNKEFELTQAFLNYLETLINTKPIEYLAEEFSIDALKISGVTRSTVKEITNKHKLIHIYSDPTLEKRDILGIRTDDQIKDEFAFKSINYNNSTEFQKKLKIEKAKDYHIRENYWLNTIAHLRQKSGIFICGTIHIKSFALLLSKNNFKVVVLPEKFCTL